MRKSPSASTKSTRHALEAMPSASLSGPQRTIAHVFVVVPAQSWSLVHAGAPPSQLAASNVTAPAGVAPPSPCQQHALLLFVSMFVLAAICWAMLNPKGTLFGDAEEQK